MKFKELLLAASILLFIGSMFLPAIPRIVDFSSGHTELGYQLLFFGWIAIFGGMLSWLANIFGPIAIIYINLKKFKKAYIFSLIALVVSF